MLYQNVRGLNSKLKDIYLNSIDCGYGVICLSETWLKSSVNNSEVFYNDYQVFRKDRAGEKSGGGVLIAVHCTISTELVTFSSDIDSEFICVRLRIGVRSIFITCSYIPPRSNIDIYFEHLRLIELTFNLMDSTSEIICVGDFNLPTTSWVSVDDSNGYLPLSSSTTMNAYWDGIFDLGLHQFNYIKNVNNRILDLVFSNCNCISLCRVSPFVLPEDKFHPTIKIVLDVQGDISVADRRTESSTLTFNFAKTNSVLLRHILQQAVWSYSGGILGKI